MRTGVRAERRIVLVAIVTYWSGHFGEFGSSERVRSREPYLDELFGVIGLKPDSVDDGSISLRQKRLVTREVLAGFALIESRTHAAFEAARFPFLGGIARFVPHRKIRDLRETLVGLRVEFNQLVDRFVANDGRTDAEPTMLPRAPFRGACTGGIGWRVPAFVFSSS